MTRRTAQRKYHRVYNRAMRVVRPGEAPVIRLPSAVYVKLGILSPDWNKGWKSGVIDHERSG